MSENNGTPLAIPPEVAPPEAKQTLVAYSAFSNIQAFEEGQRMAKALMSSNLIPDKFKNNIGDCLIVLELSQRMQCSAFALMNKLYEVHGRWAMMAEFMIASVNQSGKCTPIRYEEGPRDANGEFMENDDSYCMAWVEDHKGMRLESVRISNEMAKAQGWWGKKDSHWPKNPQLMRRYRAATYLARQFFPELTLGMSTVEELHDIGEQDTVRGNHGTDLDKKVMANDDAIDAEIIEEDDQPPEKDTEEISAEALVQSLRAATTTDRIDELEDACREMKPASRQKVKAAAADARSRLEDVRA